MAPAGHGRHQPWSPSALVSLPGRLDLLCRDRPLQQNSREVGERTTFPDAALHQMFSGGLGNGDGDAPRHSE